jgi:hypothetical protein
MSDRPALHHILALQGSDYLREFQFWNSIIMRAPITSFFGSGTLQIYESPIAASIGTVLRYGDAQQYQFTTVTAIVVGSTQVEVTAATWPGSAITIPAGDEIAVSPTNITGWQLAAQVWPSACAETTPPATTPLATFTTAITSAANGRFTLSLPRLTTTAMAANCGWQDYQGINIDDLGKTSLELTRLYNADSWRAEALAAAAYFWDLEATNGAAQTTRRIEGLFLLSRERTR